MSTQQAEHLFFKLLKLGSIKIVGPSLEVIALDVNEFSIGSLSSADGIDEAILFLEEFGDRLES